MEGISLSKPKDISEAWWKEVCKKVKQSVVYVDDYVVESLHWTGGINRLFNSGCKDVKTFSLEEASSKTSYDKAVFLISGAITGSNLSILKRIIINSHFKYVIIVTGAHSSVHAFSSSQGQESEEGNVMGNIEETILEWMDNVHYTVELFYFPLFMVSTSENVFLMPKFFDISPIFEDEIPRIVKYYLMQSRSDRKPINTLDELEFYHLPFRLQESIFHFISTIHSLLQGINAREEIYFMGHLSRIVAGELETYLPARQRRKTAMSKVSLVLLDRSLDLVSPTEFGGSVLMSRILTLLQRLPGHKIDSVVDLNSLSSTHESCDWTLLPGCFAHQNESVSKEILNLMMKSNKKNCLLKLNQEQGLGVIEVLKHERVSHLDQLHSVEKMLLQSLNDPQSETSPFSQVIQLLKTRNKKNILIEEVLALLIYLSSLGGFPVFKMASEYEVTNPLSQAFVEDKEKNEEILDVIFREEIDEVSALKVSSKIWERLVSVSRTRANLKDYRNLCSRANESEPYTYQNIISSVIENCLNPPQQQITDLECKSAGFKDLIKTGFSLFVNVSKPRPKDAAQMIIYVLGGITPAEVAEIERLVEKYQPNCEVLIGSSHFTYPQDIVRQCFNNI
ncbi:Sec1 family domain-containing protein 2 [Armadillidium vulgare]|nr:Sec1 family domain-containing protein 2 [Armadillidium vulgare]